MITLRELCKKLGVELPIGKNEEDLRKCYGEMEYDRGYNDCKRHYDNLEIPIEKLKPSVEEIAIELLYAELGMQWYTINDEEKEYWIGIAQAIYKLKPGGNDE